MEGRKYKIGKSHLTLIFGDITTSKADVIVSSDDYMLSMGGGVSASIRRAAGETLVHDAAKLIPRKLGDVIITTAGALPAKYVFHVVTIGPSGKAKTPVEVVGLTTRKCLELLGALGLKSIAFPAIGAGVARFDYNDVAVIMADAAADHLRDLDESLELTIYLFDRFRRMSPMDFVTFFEEFSARSRQLGSEMSPTRVTQEKAGEVRQKEQSAEVRQRRELVDELAALSQERDLLEQRLAEAKETLGSKEWQDIAIRLQLIHQRRVDLLAESQIRQHGDERVSIFVSYAHADKRLKLKLMKHLRTLERDRLVSVWHDRLIAAGSEWKGVIDRNLETARVVLLLISADFVNSDYCYDIEMKRALERHGNGEATVIPVLLRPVVWNNCPFSKLQALPVGAKPVTEWANPDSAYVNIVEGIRSTIEQLHIKAPNPIGQADD